MMDMLTRFSLIMLISLAIAIPVLLPMFIVLAVFARKKQHTASVPMYDTAEKGNTLPDSVESPDLHQEIPSSEKEKKTHNFNSSQLLLLIGTAFVVLSGIAFGVASWVKTTPTGRVAIIVAAAAVSFLISFFFRKVLKLKGTSASFYSVGSIFSSIALLTAGAYQLMGEWFSFSGDGLCMLLTLSSLLIAALSIIGYKLYDIKASGYVGLYAVSLSVIFAAAQLTDEFMYFAVLMILIQAVITALFNIFEFHKYIPLQLKVRTAANITSITYAAISVVYVVSKLWNPTLASFAILAAIIFQMIFYGITLKNRSLILLQCITSIFSSIVVGNWFGYKFENNLGLPVFGLCLILIFLANKFIPALRNGINSKISLGAASFAVLALFLQFGNDVPFLGYVVTLTMACIYLIYTFSNNTSAQYLCGIAAPVTFIANAFMFYEDKLAALYNDDSRTLYYCFFVCVMLAVNAMICYLPQISFRLYVKTHRESDVLLYTNLILTAIVMIALSGEEYALCFIPAIIAHYILSHKVKNNFAGMGSVFAILSVIFNYLSGYTDLMTRPVSYIMLGLLAVLTLVSRIMYSKALVYHTDNKVRIDVIQLTSWLAIFYSFTGYNTPLSIKLLAIALYIANFVRKNTKPNTSAVILTISTLITMYALIIRPFFVFDSDIITSKINLAIIALTGFAFSIIWKKHTSAAKLLSTGMYIFSFASLIFDAMKYHSAGNTIFVLAVTALILIISSSVKSKTWFTASSAALIIITLYSTKKYLMTLNWWAYLFIVGLILIGAAAFNEFCKSRNISPKETVKAKFAGWKW